MTQPSNFTLFGSNLFSFSINMNILSKVDAYFSKSFEKFRKPSEAVSEDLTKDFVAKPQKLPPNLLPISETVLHSDGRTKPRSQKQIEAYKKNFSNRHKQISKSELPQNKQLKIFSETSI